MSRITRTSALAILLALPVGCASNNSSSGSTPTVVTDTLGKRFDASCSGGFCTLTPEDPTLKPLSCDYGYGSDTFVMLWSRVLTLHILNVVAGAPIEINAGEPSHPVACATDADCTPWNATLGATSYQFACVNQICQDTAISLTAEDVVTLCQADIPWPTTCPYVATEPFASRLAEIAAVCGAPAACSVPADCWQAAAPVDGGLPASGLDGGV